MIRFLTFPLLFFTLITAPWLSRVSAQSDFDQGPAVVISIQAVDKQLKDVKHFMEVAGFGFFAPMMDASVSEYLRGIDTDRAACVSLYFIEDEVDPRVVAYLPITDLEDILDMIADFADIDEDGDEIVVTTDDGTRFNIKELNGFAVISNDSSLFDRAPGTPTEILGDLPDRFNLSARVFGQRIPESLRAQAIEMIRQGFEESMQNMGDDDIQDVDSQMESMESLINETELLVIGLDLDRSEGLIGIEFEMIGSPGSRLSQQAETGRLNKTKFAGFLADDATMSINVCSTLLPEDIEQAKKSIDQAIEAALDQMANEMNQDDLKIFEQVMDELVEVVKATMDDGVIDLGTIGYIDGEQFNVALGSRNSDTAKFEATIRRLIGEFQEKASQHGVEIAVAFDESTHRSVTFHQITVTVPDDEQEMKDIFGDRLLIIVGISQSESYLAAGQNPKQLLIDAIDRSAGASADLPAGQLKIAVAPLLDFAYRLQKDESLAEMAESLRKAGNDKITMVSKFVPDGQSFRMEIQDGIIKAIALLGAQMGPMGRVAPGDDF